MIRVAGVAVYALINSLFLLKYLTRTPLHPQAVLAVYLLISGGTWLLIQYPPRWMANVFRRPLKYETFVLSGFVLIAIIVLNQLIDPQLLQVDRWSAIAHFLQNLLAGDYPYLAQTHLGGYGSPFPVWNFVHLPFYLLGDVGYAMPAFFILLVLSLNYILGNYRRAFVFVLLLALSPAFWYEVAVRSDLIYNFILCFLIVGWWYRRDVSVDNSPLVTGIVSGLVLSTRLSIVIPFFIFLFPEFLATGWKQRMMFTLAGLVTFALSFLPFLLWDLNSLVFFEYNPFVLQTRQGSWIEIGVLLAMLLSFSLLWRKSPERLSLFIAVTLIVFITGTFLHRMISDDFQSGLFSSRYDITYFTMALPFSLAALAGFEKSQTSV